VNHAVVAAECAPPDDVSRRAVEFRDDIAAAPTTVGTTAARHIRMLVALRQISRQKRVLPARSPDGADGLTGIASISPDDDAIVEVRASTRFERFRRARGK
jgi:hypothetical protein